MSYDDHCYIARNYVRSLREIERGENNCKRLIARQLLNNFEFEEELEIADQVNVLYYYGLLFLYTGLKKYDNDEDCIDISVSANNNEC